MRKGKCKCEAATAGGHRCKERAEGATRYCATHLRREAHRRACAVAQGVVAPDAERRL